MSNYTLEINKQVELVQVLLYLAERQEKTVQHLNNKYYSEKISDYFSSYRNHCAVELTQNLIDETNFIHIRPLKAILSLEHICKDETHALYSWANAVEQFKNDTKFDQFFYSNNDYYDIILQKINSFGIDEWISFIENYFDNAYSRFKLIICPINGNYGFALDVPDHNTSYSVMCIPYYDESGNILWREDFFAKGVAHEYAHCFVNPVVESNKEKLIEIKSFFNLHDNIPNFYNVDYAVMNEYWVRAFAIRFMTKFKDKFPAFDIDSELTRQRAQFLFIDEFIELLIKFENLKFENHELSFQDFYINSIEDIKKLGY